MALLSSFQQIWTPLGIFPPLLLKTILLKDYLVALVKAWWTKLWPCMLTTIWTTDHVSNLWFPSQASPWAYYTKTHIWISAIPIQGPSSLTNTDAAASAPTDLSPFFLCYLLDQLKWLTGRVLYVCASICLISLVPQISNNSAWLKCAGADCAHSAEQINIWAGAAKLLMSYWSVKGSGKGLHAVGAAHHFGVITMPFSLPCVSPLRASSYFRIWTSVWFHIKGLLLFRNWLARSKTGLRLLGPMRSICNITGTFRGIWAPTEM